MEAKQIVAALESGSLEDHKTAEAMAEAALLIVAQQARIKQLKDWQTKSAHLIKHADNCLWITALPTGHGYCGCSCGASDLVVDGEPIESGYDDLTALRAHDAAIWRDAATYCKQQADEWDSDRVLTFKNYAGNCADELSARAAAIEKFNGNDGATGKTHKLICPRCGVDRFNVPCPEPLHLCPVQGKAQSAAIKKGGE